MMIESNRAMLKVSDGLFWVGLGLKALDDKRYDDAERAVGYAIACRDEAIRLEGGAA